MKIKYTDAQVRRIVGDAQCTGDAYSQNEHLCQIARHLADTKSTARFRDEFDSLLPRLHCAIEAQSVTGGKLVDMGSDFAQSFTQKKLAPDASDKLWQILGTCASFLVKMVTGYVANLFLSRRESLRIDARIKQREVTLLPLLVPGHAMMLEIKRQPNEKYTLRIYNTGGGLENHLASSKEEVPQRLISDQSGATKLPTAFEVVDVPAEALKASDLRRICGLPHFRSLLRLPRFMYAALTGQGGVFFANEARCLYWDWAASKGTVRAVTQKQKVQQSGNCTYKSVLAVLRHNLSDGAYREFKARWLEHVASRYPPAMGNHALRQVLTTKAARARRKFAANA